MRGPMLCAARNRPARQPIGQGLHVLAPAGTDQSAEFLWGEGQGGVVIHRSPQSRSEKPSNQASQPPHAKSLAQQQTFHETYCSCRREWIARANCRLATEICPKPLGADASRDPPQRLSMVQRVKPFVCPGACECRYPAKPTKRKNSLLSWRSDRTAFAGKESSG